MDNARALEVTTPSDREVMVTRVFDAPRRLVFEAHTKCDLVKRWLTGPSGWSMVVCEIDLKVGGTFRYVLRNTDGNEMGWGGIYREILPYERVVHTELFDEDWTNGETLVTTILTERAGRTTLTMTVLYGSQEARDGALAIGMTDGMAMSYDLLDAVLASMPTSR